MIAIECPAPTNRGIAAALRFRYFSGDFQNGIVAKPNLTWEYAVARFSRKFDLRMPFRNNCWHLRSPFLWVSLLVLSICAGNSIAKGGAIQNGAAASAGPGLTVAIADFDGDQRPDLASIQGGHNASGPSTYWIQFQFSIAGRQSLQLVAPPGGLRIEARDVNGDHAVDLIFTTAWFRQPVAILLNDGHGSFSRAEPTAFPGVFSDSNTRWAAAARQAAAAVALPPQSRAGVDETETGPRQERPSTSLVLRSVPAFPADTFLFSSAGRAPPSAVSIL